MKRTIVLVVSMLLAIALLAGCSAKPAASTSAPATTAAATTVAATTAAATTAAAKTMDAKDVKIGYICKMLTNPWFVSEDNGMKDTANKLGSQYFSIDANLNDEACDAAIDNALAQKITGMVICITNQGNGPAVIKKCQDAGIPVIAIDDNISDSSGNPAPYVGMPTKDVGVLGGTELAKEATAKGFFNAGNVTKVIQIDAPTVTVLKPRLDGYKQALEENTPLKDADFIEVQTTACMEDDSLKAVQPIIQAHPEVTNWIVTGANDDSAVAALKAIQEQGKVATDHTLVCGLGGYALSVDQFEKGNANYMTVVLDPYTEGVDAYQEIFDNLTKGTPIPQNTYVNGKVATLDNWKTLITPASK